MINDPEALEWLRLAGQDIVPKLRDSMASVTILSPGEPDAKLAIELGFSILLDKPIILAVTPGAEVPEALRKVAFKVLEVDLTSDDAREQFAEQMRDVLTEIEP